MKLKNLLLIACLLLGLHVTHAQTGREFWFVAPDVTVQHGDGPLVLRVTTLGIAANVTVSMPGDGTVLHTQSIPAFTQVNFELDKNVVENRPSNSVNKKGILITSDQDITAYYELTNGVNSEKFTLKGSYALGKEFYVPSQKSYRNFPLNPMATEKVDIVATEDGTAITILPTDNILGHSKNVAFTINLNKGETYCLENRNDIDQNSSLAGTHLQSNKNIAVTISDDSVWEEQYHPRGHIFGPYDLIGDQLIPVSVIGTEYIAIRSNKDHHTLREVYVLATEDNTYITVNNDVTIPIVLNKGEQVKIDMADFYADFAEAHSIYIKSSKPVYAYQLASFWNVSGNEMGSAVLPPINCNGSQSVSFVRTFDLKFYVQLLTQGKNRHSFVFKDQNGRTLDNISGLIVDEAGLEYPNINAIPWHIVKGTGVDGAPDTWYSSVVSMSLTTGVPYTISNNTGLFQMSILDENQGSTSYGYFSSYAHFKIDAPGMDCQGNGVVLHTTEPMKSYKWFSEKTGQVVQSTEPSYKVTESGKYWVTAEVNFGGCMLTESINVDIALPPFDLGPDEVICPGETVDVSVPSGLGTYLWSGGSTTNTTSHTLMAGETKTVSLTVTDENNCSNTDSKVISTHPTPVINLDKTEVCAGEKIINQSSLVRYEWHFGTTLLNADWTQNYIIPTQSGTYTLSAWDAKGCLVNQDFDITVNPLPVFDIPDQLGCAATTTINVPAAVSGAGYTYLWSDGSTLDHINLTTPTHITLQVTDPKGCVAVDESIVANPPSTAFDLGPDREECTGITLTIDQGNNYTNYDWKFQAGGVGPIVDLPIPTPEHTLDINGLPINSGRYYVSAIDQFGCAVADNVLITFVNVDPPVLALNQNLCRGDEITVSTSPGYDSYQWFLGGALQAGLTTNSITVTTPGVYTVEASKGGCVKTDAITVTQYENPTVQLVKDFSICANTEGTITVDAFNAAAGSTFDYLEWNGGQNRYNDWSTAALNVNTPGTYTVTAHDNNGCKATDVITVGQFAETPIELGAPRETCENVSIDLVNPTTVANYEWHKLTSAGAIAGPVNTNWTVNSAGSYRLTITDVNGCKNEDIVVVKTLPLPLIELGADRDVCEGELVKLTADAGYAEYLWNGNPIFNTNTYSFNGTGVTKHTVAVKSVHGCWANDNITISAQPSPAFNMSDQQGCSNTNLTISVPNEVSGPGFSYLWSNGSSQDHITAESPGELWLKVRNTSGCEITKTFIYSHFPTTPFNLIYNRTSCSNVSLNVAEDHAFNHYHWQFQKDSNGSFTDLTSQSPEHTYNINLTSTTQSGHYKASAIDQYGCTYSDMARVDYINLDEPVITADNKLYSGGSINLSTLPIYDTYTWYVNGVIDASLTGYTINIKEPGVYKVEVGPKGCISNSSYTVELSTPTLTSTTASEKMVIYPNPSKGNFTIQLGDENRSFEKIQVYNTLGQLIKTIKNPINNNFFIGQKGLFIVIVHTNSGIYKTNLIIE